MLSLANAFSADEIQQFHEQVQQRRKPAMSAMSLSPNSMASPFPCVTRMDTWREQVRAAMGKLAKT
jgi:hypothetical protein